ncbi:uncharacterized protein CcaverHIS019_0701390 [Cutaneotrichosporon cavernicola]|uniref:GB1/RHD3-type G domain-containing protein n=1 Tax=Cutaneotrichosporon cavernicola TaxID=279322 RepID=A0AA48L9V0_9TREE|nr:uncharacterized protein CcaverHIS019_0701390 [Cutaneotrichosporon cavernicola]BEI94567.1 hypothetical protein CcaverHIS019_0701390 [Cutaneotrichosporon cavernicola]BEJ02343.1 hypothetical protein CcaverHIS631_0701380 [Cutaneotrichosporon cavernicola]
MNHESDPIRANHITPLPEAPSATAAAPAAAPTSPVVRADMTVPAPVPSVTAPVTQDGQLAKIDQLQIIDEAQHFTPNLNKYLTKWDLINSGFDYNVVAVFGSQSTGKSTLLNRLFGTTFDIMDSKRRQQTTKGIWMCPSAYSAALVMDVEGTDGRERGEDQDFERKSALFSLASSEVLIVNIWEHQIGLYQGANLGLLKTVFEVNLSLFGGSAEAAARPKEKTLILFVIRDHSGYTTLTSLADTLKESMAEIWQSLSKPTHLANAKLDTYFDLSFAVLPHKIHQPEKFEADVVELRRRFVDKTRPDYVFQPSYHKRIPADGLNHYMEGVWAQVLANKDLDLPTQQELLAQFRCDELAAGVTELFNVSSKTVRRPIESGKVVAGLGKLMSEWLHVALTSFDAAASRYHPGVYQRKRQDLVTNLHATLSPLYLGELKNTNKAVSAMFVTDLTAALKEPSYDFAEVVSRCTRDARKSFLAVAKESTIEGSGWEYEQELALLDDSLKSIADKSRADETKKMVNGIERTVKRQLYEPVEIALSKPSPTMWDKVLSTYRDVTRSAEQSYLKKAKAYDCTEEENEVALRSLATRSWLALHHKLEEQTADPVVLSTLRDNFEQRFRYDEHGVPRVWRPEDDLEGAFKTARDETLTLLPLFAKVKPKDEELLPKLPVPDATETDSDPENFDPETAFVLVKPSRLSQLEARFKREADAAYVEAKRSMVSSVSQIPLWIYGALVVLGWNEAMAVLFNPLYFAMLLVAAASAYLVLQLGLAGPIFQVTRTVANEVKRIGTEKLREAFAEPAPQRTLEHPHRAESGVNASRPERRGQFEHYELEEK